MMTREMTAAMKLVNQSQWLERICRSENLRVAIPGAASAWPRISLRQAHCVNVWSERSFLAFFVMNAADNTERIVEVVVGQIEMFSRYETAVSGHMCRKRRAGTALAVCATEVGRPQIVKPAAPINTRNSSATAASTAILAVQIRTSHPMRRGQLFCEGISALISDSPRQP